MLKRLTTFMIVNTGEGKRVAFTYTTINGETGEIIEQNIKKNFLVLDDGLASDITSIENYIKNRFLTTEE